MQLHYFPLQDNPNSSWVPCSKVLNLSGATVANPKSKDHFNPRSGDAFADTTGIMATEITSRGQENESFLSSAAPKLALNTESSDTCSRRSFRRCKVPVGFHEDDDTLYRRQIKIALKASCDTIISDPITAASTANIASTTTQLVGNDQDHLHRGGISKILVNGTKSKSKLKARNRNKHIDTQSVSGSATAHEGTNQDNAVPKKVMHTTARKSVAPQPPLDREGPRKVVTGFNRRPTRRKGVVLNRGARSVRRNGSILTTSMKAPLQATLCCTESDEDSCVDQFMERARNNAIGSRSAWLEYCSQMSQSGCVQSPDKGYGLQTTEES